MSVDVMPILPSWDFDLTSRFYEQLGFEERGRWEGSYLIMAHPAKIELHFFASPEIPPSTNDHGVYVRFSSAVEVDSLHAIWSDAKLDGGQIHEPVDTDYGLREFALLDPMRNLLRVGGLLDG